MVAIAHHIHPLVGLGVASVLLASCFAEQSLRRAAADVLHALATGDLVVTRQRLSQYVGRDTASMTEADILRAVLETVTENATDGVFAPLFYAVLGSVGDAVWMHYGPGGQPLGGTGSGAVAFALAYKAASTLDSMVGYREPPYRDLGWFSARAEDHLTWLPCRGVVVTLALLSGRPRSVWRMCQRDAPQDPSPNSGWSECVYAAILGVQLGGDNWYQGRVKRKPRLGDAIRPITPGVIRQALTWTRSGFWLWLVGAMGLAHGLSL
jgi:adenosylcobinamide-phosphate synthase